MRPGKPKHTAAWRLFHSRYLVRLPQTMLYGPEYLKKVGYNITQDPQVDAGAPGRIATVNQTGAGIAILHAQGAPLDFVHRDHIPRLYNDIQEHLNDWYNVAYQGVHPDAAPPIEDFRMFEMVAMELYPHAKRLKPQEPDRDLVRNRLLEMNQQRNPAYAAIQARRRHSDEHGNLKPYESIVDKIEELLLGD